MRPIRFLKSFNTYLLRQAISEADQVVAFSHFSRDLIMKGINNTCANKIKVISPGVENSWFEVERKTIFWLGTFILGSNRRRKRSSGAFFML